MNGGLNLSNEGVGRGEERAGSKGKVLYLLICLRSNNQLWSRVVDHDRRKGIPDASGQNELPP